MVSDFGQWPGRSGTFADSTIHRALAVPLKLNQRVIGVLNIADDRSIGSFTADQIKLVSLFADQAAIAIENARLHDQVRHYAAELERRVAERITRLHSQSSPGPDQVSIKAHLDHLIAEPMWRIYGAATVRQQDKRLDALAIADLTITSIM